jgi:drug/metabolite transporter (DMT)-like permease
MTQTQPSRARVYAALIAIQVLFGINYVVTKQILGVFPPLVWASARIIVASLVMVAAALLMKRKHPEFSTEFFKPLLAFALLGAIINQGSFLVGLQYTTATNSAILNTLIPIFTLLVVTVRGQEALTWKRAAGFFISLIGVLVIRKIEDFSLSNQTLVGDLLTMANCLSYALFLSFSKKFLERNDRIWTTAWMFIYGSIGLTLLAAPSWMTFHLPVLHGEMIAYMLFAVIGGTLLTYFLSIWSLAYTKSSSVALFVYLQPIIASGLAWAWFGQEVTLRTTIAGVLIFLGMMLSLSRPAAAKG